VITLDLRLGRAPRFTSKTVVNIGMF
jgi:hypothetical protein